MRTTGLLLLFVFLFSCKTDTDQTLIRINKESILHDNSSKVWVISRVLQKGVNVAKTKFNQKDVAIFFKSGKVFFQPISSLGNFPERGGSLVLSEDSQSLFLDFGDEKWDFTVKEISSARLFLKHRKESDFKYDLELISYPEGE